MPPGRARVAWLGASVLALACATQPEVEGPRPLGHGASIFKGSGELRVEYHYEPRGPRELVLYVEMSEVGGAEVGAIEVATAFDGFTVLDGEPRWTAKVPARGTDRHALRLRASHSGTAAVTISSRHLAAGETVSTTTMMFRVHEEQDIRPCRASDEECQGQ